MTTKLNIFLITIIVSGLTSYATLKGYNHFDTSNTSLKSTFLNLLDTNPEAVKSALEKALQNEAKIAQQTQSDLIKKTSAQLIHDHHSPIMGNENGTIEMVLFIDPLCGYCRKFHPVLLEAAKEIKNLKIIVKDFPIIGGDTSLRIIRMGLAANKQGKYQEFIDNIYETDKFTQKDLEKIAKKVNLNLIQLRIDMESKEILESIRQNVKLGRDLGVDGTPAFIVHHQLFTGYKDFESVKKILLNSING